MAEGGDCFGIGGNGWLELDVVCISSCRDADNQC